MSKKSYFFKEHIFRLFKPPPSSANVIFINLCKTAFIDDVTTLHETFSAKLLSHDVISLELPVAHAHIQGNPEGGQVTFGSHVTTTKKKARGKVGHAHNLLPIRTASGQGLFRSRDFRQKGHTRTDIAQLLVAHAQNILPDRARD
jgi:hypothetical protein